jgi:hypothetical protein
LFERVDDEHASDMRIGVAGHACIMRGRMDALAAMPAIAMATGNTAWPREQANAATGTPVVPPSIWVLVCGLSEFV